nr:unnamed protein product [Digitaria exilis]
MDKQVRPRRSLDAACGALPAGLAWHRRAAAIKRQADAFELRSRNEGLGRGTHDGTKPMQHACRRQCMLRISASQGNRGQVMEQPPPSVNQETGDRRGYTGTGWNTEVRRYVVVVSLGMAVRA